MISLHYHSRLLSAHGTPGVYLIRDGSRRGCQKIISIWYPGKCYHMVWSDKLLKIQLYVASLFFLLPQPFLYKGEKMQFSTLLELIEFFSKHPLANTTAIYMKVPYS